MCISTKTSRFILCADHRVVPPNDSSDCRPSNHNSGYCFYRVPTEEVRSILLFYACELYTHSSKKQPIRTFHQQLAKGVVRMRKSNAHARRGPRCALIRNLCCIMFIFIEDAISRQPSGRG